VELDQVHEVFEVLHEFLVINAAIAIDVSHHVKGECLLLCEVQFRQLLQALLVFLPLEEAVVMDVTLSECCKHNAVLDCRHAHVALAELPDGH
jgi:hypothetical protein